MEDKKVQVQEWVDNLPLIDRESSINHTAPSPSLILNGHRNHQHQTCHCQSPRQCQQQRKMFLVRDSSIQSDCSHCSSVESVLEFRKPDPEAVLIGLGFGPRNPMNYATRIPERFLKPSKLIKHIDINKFLEEQGQTQILDHNIAMQSPEQQQRPKGACN